MASGRVGLALAVVCASVAAGLAQHHFGSAGRAAAGGSFGGGGFGGGYNRGLQSTGSKYGGGGGGGGYSGGRAGGVQTLQSSPLPPPGYVSPSVYREQAEPPKPFKFKHEGPDPYGGFSSHEAEGDEYGRVVGQYTVQNPDGTSRLVKYVADPELGFHAEVDTDEEGTKTSAPANALIRSTAPEDGYQQPQQPAKSAYQHPQQSQHHGYAGSQQHAVAGRLAGGSGIGGGSLYNQRKAYAGSTSGLRASTYTPTYRSAAPASRVYGQHGAGGAAAYGAGYGTGYAATAPAYKAKAAASVARPTYSLGGSSGLGARATPGSRLYRGPAGVSSTTTAAARAATPFGKRPYY